MGIPLLITNALIQIISKTINKDGVEKEILQGRYATVIGFSSKKGLVRAYLLHEKTGQRLNCPITLEVGKFNKVADDWKFEDTLKTEEPVAETASVGTPENQNNESDVQVDSTETTEPTNEEVNETTDEATGENQESELSQAI
jgi:hypothetical protein